MSASAQYISQRLTLAEYFEFESKSATRHEFQDGIVVEMGYASDNHELIVANLMLEIGNCLKSSGCLVYPSNRILFVQACNKTFYPDVSVYCGERESYKYSENVTALVNPSVLIEVLSPTTERDDKDKKWRCYKQLPSLQQYILIAQDEIFIRILTRTNDDKQWLQTEFDKEDDTIKIGDCVILLKDIYLNTEQLKGESVSDSQPN
jgi:Uma2 family endonuclease